LKETIEGRGSLRPFWPAPGIVRFQARQDIHDIDRRSYVDLVYPARVGRLANPVMAPLELLSWMRCQPLTFSRLSRHFQLANAEHRAKALARSQPAVCFFSYANLRRPFSTVALKRFVIPSEPI